jgi:hypothetical protein
MNLKGCEIKLSRPNLRSFLGIVMERLRTTTKTDRQDSKRPGRKSEGGDGHPPPHSVEVKKASGLAYNPP